jgi:aurora kinase, other
MILTAMKLLVLDPEQRIPLEKVQQHPWIIKHCLNNEKSAKTEKTEG